jgi:hypothetical protein
VKENILPEAEASNKGPKKRFENRVPDAIDDNPGKEVKTVHEYKYPDTKSKRPESSSHGVLVDGKRKPQYDSGPIPNDASAKNTKLKSER